MQHSFYPELAKKYESIEIAVLINYFDFWLSKNKANNKNFQDGTWWTYNSVKAFSKLFIYLSESKIRYFLDKMVTLDILRKDNFNKSSYDRTNWYTFSDAFVESTKSICAFSQMDLPKVANRFDESSEPIPDNKPDDKPVSKPIKTYSLDVEFLFSRCLGLFKERKPHYLKNLSSGYETEWKDAFRLMIIADHRPPAEIEKILDHMTDITKSWWAETENIRSPLKLRKRNRDKVMYYDIILSEMQRPKKKSNYHQCEKSGWAEAAAADLKNNQ